MEKKLDQAKDAVRLCKLNIKNQQKKLEAWNKKIEKIKNKMANADTLSPNELEKLMIIDSKLIGHANVHTGIILELQEDLIINENTLKQLKSNL